MKSLLGCVFAVGVAAANVGLPISEIVPCAAVVVFVDTYAPKT